MIILLYVALMAVAAIAYKALTEWDFYKKRYDLNYRWWDSRYSDALVAKKQWHELYVNSLAAAQDLDKQVSDCRYVIAENNIRIAMLEREVDSCNDIIDDADADIAMLHTNITEMFMENQMLEAERNGYYKELESIKANNTLTPICHKCKRRMKKESLLVDGRYTCDWCKNKRDKLVKPLLSDAKVGDKVRLRNGDIDTIISLENNWKYTGKTHPVELIKEPNDIDLSNLPDIFDAETAGKIIEAGGYVSLEDYPDSYYALSTKNDGSVGCFPINKAPFAGWFFTSVKEFVETKAGISFTKATPDFLKGDKK